jgi:hypothetical protein
MNLLYAQSQNIFTIFSKELYEKGPGTRGSDSGAGRMKRIFPRFPAAAMAPEKTL